MAFPTASARSAPAYLSLAVLTACVCTVGTAEYVMTGLVPELSADLDRPVSATGSLVG
ncbi:MAG: MFS transporter, partial [Streptomycetaceae bacterium]|nr:MFS transporter [Streptomycetaceae bacterium]